MIMEGKVDQYPEAAFMNVGTIEDAIEKGEKILAQNK
jgi:F-type H+-transporting ATPase subunit beta